MSAVEVTLIIAWICSLILTPLAIRLAPRFGWVDLPTERKRHTGAVPVVGGLAVMTAACLAILSGALWSPAIRESLWGSGSLAALGLGTLGVAALGFVDDLRGLNAGVRLLLQIALASLVWGLGFQVGAIELPFGWQIEKFTLLSFFVTVGWIVLLTNAFNFIDGIDGLSAGTAGIATLMILWLASWPAYLVPSLGAAALAGALAGFLRFNLAPARIFLGDSGAMSIGFAIAVLSIASSQKSPTAAIAIVPLLGLALPLLDAGLAVLRRLRRQLRSQELRRLRLGEVGRALMSADRGHIHHLLLRSGWSVRSAVYLLYAVSAGLAFFAIWSRTMSASFRWTAWLLILTGGLVALRRLELRVERAEATGHVSSDTGTGKTDAARRREIAGSRTTRPNAAE